MGQKLGRYIKTERRNKKISVKIMGEKTGISKSYLDYIESGAREPQVEMLAKIAVILQVPIETLLNIQQKEQLELAITKLKASNVDVSDDEIRAVARTADSNLVIDEQALAQTQEAFRTAPDDKQLAEWLCDRVLHIEQGKLK